MILDQKLFDSTSPQSAKRIAVRCDTCGSMRLVIKQNLFKAKSHDCKPCVASRNGSAHRGMKRSEQHRLKTSIASAGRKWSEEQRRNMSETRSGENSPRWIQDRELVAKNKVIRKCASTLLRNAITRVGGFKSGRTSEMVGYTSDELAAHLESQFLEGMSWANRGKWHVDHIKPVQAFLNEGITDLRVINALENLQPLWALDNLKKGASY